MAWKSVSITQEKKIVGSGSTGVLPRFLFSFTPRAYADAKEYRKWNGLRDFSSLPLVGPFSTSQFLDGDMREIRPL